MAEQIHLSRQNVAELNGSGDPSGSITPDYVGQIYRDTNSTPNGVWMSTGVNNTDWQNLTGFNDDIIHYSTANSDINKRTAWTIKRTVTSRMKATFEIEIFTDGQSPFTIPDVIPLNFLGKEFFKVNRYASIILDIAQWGDQRLRDGAMTSTSGSPTITGVGTNFTEDFKPDDFLWDGTSYLGQIDSITSDTVMTLKNNTLVVVTGVDVYCAPIVSQSGFWEAAFNDLVNSHSSNAGDESAFRVQGYWRGQMCQFEDTMGFSYELPQVDIDPNTSLEYQANYAPKDLTVSPLNMTYRADDEGNYSNGTSEGKFRIVLEGFLL